MVVERGQLQLADQLKAAHLKFASALVKLAARREKILLESIMRNLSAKLLIAILIFVLPLCGLADQPLFVLRPVPGQVKKPHAAFPRLVADFEPQQALVLSISDWQPHHAPVFRQIVAKTHGHVDMLVLCNSRAQFLMAMSWLKAMEDRASHLRFVILELDTIWLRDFGPMFLETEQGSTSILDFYYAGERPRDESMPQEWARRTNSSLVRVPFTLQGGNLLSNGQHLAISTSRIFNDNAITFPYPTPGMDAFYEARKIVFEAFLKNCNLNQFIILEPLQEEATKHVDMFATFVSPYQVVVASVDSQFDPINAAILDRNARRLQVLAVDGRQLEVRRLPIPPREGRSWSAFTNIIIANDLVLVPTYNSDPQPLVAQAIQLYQKLLPDHQIKTVDISSFKLLQGELHCLSLNLPKNAPALPQTTTYAEALEAIQSGRVKVTNLTPPASSARPVGQQPQQPAIPRNHSPVYPYYPQRGYYRDPSIWQ